MESPHLALLHRALSSEEAFVREQFEASSRFPLLERVALGLSWSPVSFELVDVGRRHVEVVVRGELHEGISPGDPVEVGGLQGRCVGWDGRSAELLLRANEAQWSAVPDSASVSLALNTRAFVRLRQTLEEVDALEKPLKKALLDGPTEVEVPTLSWTGLNADQRSAADRAMAAPHLALIHGPPGTGKTRTLVAILACLVRAGERPWALAESNAAVDHLAISAASAGLEVVRVGPTFRIGAEAACLTVEARVANGPHAKALSKLDKEVSRARRAGGPSLWRLLDTRRELRETARRHVLESASVVATTLGSLLFRAQELPKATTAVVDEVTQAREPSVWAVVPWVDRMVLAGDPHQLGPVVKEPGNALERGLLHRLQEQGAFMPMLTVQHRMHAAIQALVTPVYGTRYTADPAVSAHLLTDLPGVEGTWPPVLFIDTAGAAPEERDPVSQSAFNVVEVALVALVLEQLREAGVDPGAIGVIAPYAAQVRRIAKLPAASGVEVATVNAFQGREAEVIVVSFTRSNDAGNLGFVRDRRRLTVATTRARRALVLIGDSSTLASDAAFAEILDMVDVVSVWEPPYVSVL